MGRSWKEFRGDLLGCLVLFGVAAGLLWGALGNQGKFKTTELTVLFYCMIVCAGCSVYSGLNNLFGCHDRGESRDEQANNNDVLLQDAPSAGWAADLMHEAPATRVREPRPARTFIRSMPEHVHIDPSHQVVSVDPPPDYTSLAQEPTRPPASTLSNL